MYSYNQHVATSILRAADELQCEVARTQAVYALSRIWPAKISDLQPRPDGEDFQAAVLVIDLARRYNIPAVLKNALYSLLRSRSFWDAVTNNRLAVCLYDADILTLYHARIELQRKWRKSALAPPGRCPMSHAQRSGTSSKAICVSGESARRNAWRELILNHPDVLGMDPATRSSHWMRYRRTRQSKTRSRRTGAGDASSSELRRGEMRRRSGGTT